MPNKCCVLNCRTGYDGNDLDGVSQPQLFRLPSAKEDAERRQVWIKALMENNDGMLTVTDNTRVCENHWPKGYRQCRKSSCKNITPYDPPFTSIAGYEDPLPTQHSKSVDYDHSYAVFQDKSKLVTDKWTFCSMKELLLANEEIIKENVICFENNNEFHCLSKHFHCGVYKFLIVIHQDLTYDAYFHGVKKSISILQVDKKRIVIDSLAKLSKAVTYLDNLEMDHKTSVAMEQLNTMGFSPVGEKLYEPSTIVRSFTYAAKSRACYARLLEDYPLPSLKTLSRLTSKTSNINDDNYLLRVFGKLPPLQKQA